METTASRRLLAAAVLALAAGCGASQPAPVPRDLVLTGTSQFIGLGGTSQWTVQLRLSDYSETDLQGPAEWASSDPKVASVSPNGVITANAFGSTVISVRYQSVSARKNVIVAPLAPLGLAVPQDLTFAAAGEARQLTAVLRFNDNSSVDVTTDAQWTSSDPAVVSVTPSGTLTTAGFGIATITAQYGSITAVAVVSVAPPGTLRVSGRVRLPGNGGSFGLGVPGFTVTNTDAGFSVLSNAQGSYAISAAIGTRLTFEKTGFEPADLVVTGPDASPTVQQLIRIFGGGTASATIFENDITYDPSPAFHCDNCRLIRVVNADAGVLHVQIDWTGTSGTLLLWANGTTFSSEAVTKQLTADIPVAAGETPLFIRAGGGNFVQLTLKTSFASGGHWE